jgi:hypothetical protein
MDIFRRDFQLYFHYNLPDSQMSAACQSFIDQSFVYTESFQEYMSLFQQELTDHIAFDVSFSSK